MGTQALKFSWLLEVLSIQSHSWLQEQILVLDYKLIVPLFQFMFLNIMDLDFFFFYVNKAFE